MDTLSRLGRVQTLLDFCVDIGVANITQPDDNAEYTRMLQTTMVVWLASSPAAPAYCPTTAPDCSQLQIVHRVLESLFRRSSDPNHVLALGYTRQTEAKRPFFRAVNTPFHSPPGPMRRAMSETALPVRPAAIPPRTSSLPPASTSAASSIHGVINTHPNSLWRDVTNAAWRRLLTRVGDSIMYHILMHAIVCIPLENECFAQISGPMVSTAVRTSNQSLNRQKDGKVNSSVPGFLSPNFNRFPRHRILYGNNARPSVAKSFRNSATASWIRMGLPRGNILNRCLASVTSQSLRCAESSRMLVEHIFGDGVLTLKSTQSAASNPRPRVTRRGGKRKKKSRKSVRTVVVEHAAGVADTPQKSNNVNQVKSFVRRRILRSFHLFDQIIQRHRRLPYSLLLLRHCPLKKNADRTSVHPDSSPSQVCRFALAVLRRLLPLQLLGSVHNRRILSANVCRYIRLRRNESVSVHHLVQNIKISGIPWISGSSDQPGRATTMTRSEHESACTQLLAPLIRFVIMDLVQPLLGSHFYITEGETNKSRLMYFRISAWQRIESTFLQNRVIPADASSQASLNANEPSQAPRPVVMYRHLADVDAHQMLHNRPIPADTLARYPSLTAMPRSNHLGFGLLRLMPRTNGQVRPILNLSGRSTLLPLDRKDEAVQFQSVNSLLKNVFHVLQRQYSNAPGSLGASVFDLSEIYHKLFPIVTAWKQFMLQRQPSDSTEAESKGRLYVVATDVQNCFDRMKRDALWSIISRAFKSEEFSVQRCSVTYPAPGSNFKEQSANREQAKPAKSAFGNRRKSTSNVFPLQARVEHNGSPAVEIENGNAFAREMIAKRNMRHIVFQDMVVMESLHRSSAVQLLYQHIYQNVVQLGGRFGKKKFLMQICGTPQGSVLSSYMCCALLAQVEKLEVLPLLQRAAASNGTQTSAVVSTASGAYKRKVASQEANCKRIKTEIDTAPATRITAFMRFTGRTVVPAATAESVVEPRPVDESVLPGFEPAFALLRQIDDYLLITTSRNVANSFLQRMRSGFPEYGVSISDTKTKTNFEPIADKSVLELPWIPWCGLMINSDTLDIRADYSRWANKSIADSLNVEYCRQPGVSLIRKLKYYVLPKCHALLLDSRLNTAETIAVNTYQIFLFAAIKSSAHLNALERNRDSAVPRNQRFVLDSLLISSIECFCAMTTSTMRKVSERAPPSPSTGASVFGKGMPTKLNSAVVFERQVDPTATLTRNCPLSRRAIVWLALKAFHAVFQRHHTRWSWLLRRLRAMISHKRFTLVSHRWSRAVLPKHSKALFSIDW